MKIVNIYDYRRSYEAKLAKTKPSSVYSLVNGVKQKIDSSVEEKLLKPAKPAFSYGSLAEANARLANSQAILITPSKLSHSLVKASLPIKRSQLRKLRGFDRVNPKKLMWSFSSLNIALDSITYADWLARSSERSSMNPNYVLIYFPYQASWVKLSDIQSSIKILPNRETNPLKTRSVVGLMDRLSQERALRLDLRESTSKDETIKQLFGKA